MLHPLYLERVEPARNMRRFYVLSLEPTLFGDVGLRREWGRMGRRGGSHRLELHSDADTAWAALQDLYRRKLARGYAVTTDA